MVDSVEGGGKRGSIETGRGSITLTQSVLASDKKPKAGQGLQATARVSDKGRAWMNSSMTADSEPLGLPTTRFMNDIINKSIDIQPPSLHNQSSLPNDHRTQATTSRYGDLKTKLGSQADSALLHSSKRAPPLLHALSPDLTAPLNSSRTDGSADAYLQGQSPVRGGAAIRVDQQQLADSRYGSDPNCPDLPSRSRHNPDWCSA